MAGKKEKKCFNCHFFDVGDSKKDKNDEPDFWRGGCRRHAPNPYDQGFRRAAMLHLWWVISQASNDAVADAQLDSHFLDIEDSSEPFGWPLVYGSEWCGEWKSK